jgi:hypothetical protein
MQDLTGKYPAGMTPSSMSAGNTLSDSNEPAMSAPGSESVNPLPDRLDNVVDVASAPVDDFAHLIGDGGERTARPQQAEVDAAGENAARWRTV